MNSNKIAVDVVLIPPDDIVQLAIGINKTFPNPVAENYVLDSETCVPHISLLMGVIEREQVSEVGRKLGVLAEKFTALDLTITHRKIYTSNDKVLSDLQIERTTELQKLHESILEELTSIFTYDDVQKEMFFSPPAVDDLPPSWVKGFVKNSARENYKPHITLGVGAPKEEIGPIQFTASRLALCHLGHYCTCRKVLWSTSLN